MTQDKQPQFAIHGEGISKVFKDFWGRAKVAALTDVDIQIPEHTIFGLLGPNGAGKSTLIKIILGHLYPTRGRIQVLGKSPRDVEIKRRMGYLPERSNLYKNLTALETLEFFGDILNLSRDQIQSRSEQLLEMVGLERAKNRMVGTFSHGMARRMGLAQALLNDPDLLILDEPTAGLDPIGCREFKDLIIELGKRGKTVLITTHLLADVEDVCDQILMLYGGKVQSQGRVRELLRITDRMQLEFPRVSDQALTQAKAALAGEINPAEVTVRSPSESLENYFLRVIRGGAASAQATAGAVVGAGVAQYLRAGDGAGRPDAAATLKQYEMTPTPASTSEPTTPAAEPATNVLQELEHASQASVDANRAKPESEIDRNYLDKLTK